MPLTDSLLCIGPFFNLMRGGSPVLSAGIRAVSLRLVLQASRISYELAERAAVAKTDEDAIRAALVQAQRGLDAARAAVGLRPGSEAFLLAKAHRLLAERRMRADYLPAASLGEPGWDLLLVLFIAGEEGRTIGPRASIKAAGLSDGTGARWIESLEKAGLVHRAAVPGKARPALQLTARGADAMAEILSRTV